MNNYLVAAGEIFGLTKPLYFTRNISRLFQSHLRDSFGNGREVAAALPKRYLAYQKPLVQFVSSTVVIAPIDVSGSMVEDN